VGCILSFFIVSVCVKLLRSHPHEFLSQKEYASKHACPCKVLEKTMPQTIDSSSKNDMYIMDFPTAHCLRHKKTTAAQVTTLTLYHFLLEGLFLLQELS